MERPGAYAVSSPKSGPLPSSYSHPSVPQRQRRGSAIAQALQSRRSGFLSSINSLAEKALTRKEIASNRVRFLHSVDSWAQWKQDSSKLTTFVRRNAAHKVFKQSRAINVTLGCCSLLGLALAYIEHETYSKTNGGTKEANKSWEPFSTVMRSLVWVLNVVCIVCVILAFRTREKYRNALRKGRVSERAALKTVMSPGSMAALLGSAVEICIHLISPIPGFDETYIWHDEYSGQTMDGSLSMVITWFMCVRCYQVFRLYGVLGKVDDVRWAEILHYNGSSGILWAGVKKVLYDTHSWVLLAILYFCVVIAGGLTMTVAERHQAGCTAEICSKWHGLWLGYVTTSTIGYGDLFPTTVMGRVNAVAMAFTGIITVSLAKVILEKFINDLPIVERQVLVKDQLRTLASRTRDAAALFLAAEWKKRKSERTAEHGGLPHPPPQTAHHSGHRFSLVSIQDRDNVKIRAVRARERFRSARTLLLEHVEEVAHNLDNAVISAYAEVSDGHRRMLKFATQASLHLENVFWLSENTRRNSSRLSEFHRRKHLQEAPPSHAASSRKIRSLVAARRHSALVTRLQETLQILDDEVQRADTGETLGAFMRSRSEISRSQTSEDRKPLSTPKHERKKPKGSLKVGKRVEKDRGKESSPVELQRSVLGAALAETPDGVDSLSGDGSQDGDGFEEATLGWNRDGRPSGGGPDSPNSRGRRGGPRATQDPPLHLLGSSAQPERTVAFES